MNDVQLEFTPNPNTLKYITSRTLVEVGGAYFSNPEAAEGKSLLASQLFSTTGISAVMLGRDFVTITKAEDAEWDTVHQDAMDIIKAFLDSGEPALSLSAQVTSGHITEALTENEKKIQDLLDREIRPAVAQDGGDIVFEGFRDGVVYLYLKGSCAGCPSSTATLKQGIEKRLKELVPEVREVVSVA